jgi:hypothetical protein
MVVTVDLDLGVVDSDMVSLLFLHGLENVVVNVVVTADFDLGLVDSDIILVGFDFVLVDFGPDSSPVLLHQVN